MINNASRLYDALVEFAGQSQQWADQRHLYVLVWMVVGLLSEGSVNLTRWVYPVHSKAHYAQSTQRRFSRWLHNPRLNVARLYTPLIKAALAEWQDEVLYLSLDTSCLWQQYCIIRVSVVYRGRAVRVGWRVWVHRSSSVALLSYQDLLRRVAGLMPSGVKVVLLADRGFSEVPGRNLPSQDIRIDAGLCRYVRQTLHWHYRIRVKKELFGGNDFSRKFRASF